MINKYSEQELVIWLKLSKVKGLGPRKLINLYSIFENVNRIYEASDAQLLNTRLFNEERLIEWNKLKNASEENFIKVIRECQENNIDILPLFDSNYPKKLLNVPYPPFTLFLKGDTSLFNSKIISMVGTRVASADALEWTFRRAKELANKDFTIISGGALGTDTVAHRGALESENGKTICVLGAGLLRPFPEENAGLFKEIEKKGLLMSEHLPTFPGNKIALLQRNRITSGLSEILVLCSSRLIGGAMVQSRIAFEQRVPILYPSLDLGLHPNEGPQFVRQQYGAKEVKTTEDIINFYNSFAKENPYSQKQQGL